MTGKNFNWHKAWRREGDRLVHLSGLAFVVNEELSITTCDDTMLEFSQFESARGVPVHDIYSRVKRLLKEAQEWLQTNP